MKPCLSVYAGARCAGPAARATGQRGFIGPIGDDLPSLIPLVFALIIFFSSFHLAFQTYTRTLDTFNRQIQVAELNKTIREDGYFSSFSEFRRLCNAVNVSGVYFRAGLVDPSVFPRGVPVRAFVTDRDEVTGKPVIYRGLVWSSAEGRFVPDERFAFQCHNLFRPDGAPYEGEALERFAGETFDEALQVAVSTVPVALEEHGVTSSFAVRPMHLVVVIWS